MVKIASQESAYCARCSVYNKLDPTGACNPLHFNFNNSTCLPLYAHDQHCTVFEQEGIQAAR